MPPFSLTPGLREEEKPVGVRVPVSLRVLVRRHQGGGRCRRGTQTIQGGGEDGLISVFSGLGPCPLQRTAIRSFRPASTRWMPLLCVVVPWVCSGADSGVCCGRS